MPTNIRQLQQKLVILKEKAKIEFEKKKVLDKIDEIKSIRLENRSRRKKKRTRV